MDMEMDLLPCNLSDFIDCNWIKYEDELRKMEVQ